MGFIKSSASATLFILTLLACVSALPANPPSSLSPYGLIKRGLEGNLGSLANLVSAVKDYLATENAFDADVKNKCNILMTTTSGSQCAAYLQCQETDAQGPLVGPSTWNDCFVGGRQYFTDPNIGDYSITFTEAGGVNGNNVDGLHTPVLQLANLNNWEPINIDSVIAANNGKYGNLCHSWEIAADQLLGWECGIPKIGEAAFGISNYNQTSTTGGYTPGVCTMHVVQYQRNEFGIGADYAFDVVIYDNAKKEIGLVQKASIDPNTKALDVPSALPYMMIITAAGDDQSNVEFGYAGQNWQCGDSHTTEHDCDLGTTSPRWGYENGNRKGDMSFTC